MKHAYTSTLCKTRSDSEVAAHLLGVIRDARRGSVLRTTNEATRRWTLENIRNQWKR